MMKLIKYEHYYLSRHKTLNNVVYASMRVIASTLLRCCSDAMCLLGCEQKGKYLYLRDALMVKHFGLNK